MADGSRGPSLLLKTSSMRSNSCGCCLFARRTSASRFNIYKFSKVLGLINMEKVIVSQKCPKKIAQIICDSLPECNTRSLTRNDLLIYICDSLPECNTRSLTRNDCLIYICDSLPECNTRSLTRNNWLTYICDSLPECNTRSLTRNDWFKFKSVRLQSARIRSHAR